MQYDAPPLTADSNVAIVLLDDYSRIRSVNNATEHIYGYKRAEIIGRDTIPFLIPPSCADLLDPARPKTGAANREVLIARKDGRRIWADISLTGVDLNGQVHRVLVARDISDHVAQRERDAPLLMAITHGGRPVMVLDAERRIMQVNPAFTNILGYAADEALGREPLAFLASPAMPQAELGAHRDHPWGHAHVQSEALIRSSDGRDIWMRVVSSPLSGGASAGRHGWSVDIMTDVTQERQLRDLERDVLEALMSSLPFDELGHYLCRRVREIAPGIVPSILRVDEARRLRLWSASLLPPAYSASVDGLPVEDGIGSCGTAVARGERVISRDIAQDPLWTSIAHLALPHGLRACWSWPIRRRDGTIGGAFAFYAAEPGEPGTLHERIVRACVHLCALAIEREESHRQIARLAQVDTLTGLPNPRALNRYLGDLMASGAGERIAFFWLDMDRFKDVNDLLGHAAGDQVLVTIVNRLLIHLMPGEFLARGESDQLILVSPGCDIQGAAWRATRLQEIVAEPLEVAGHPLSLSASVGISQYPDNAREPEELLRSASAAMHQAKASGGGTARFFDPEMNQALQSRLLLAAALRRTIAGGGLRLAYQPQMSADGAFYGVEALARWHDPEFGEVPPSRFIALAEETGQIEPLGRWALDEACRQLAEWRRAGVAVPAVSVNLSPLNFRSSDLPDFLGTLLETHGLSGADLTVEITESTAMALTPGMLDIVHRIRGLGIGLSVDDFGTGFSSLSNLVNLPVTEVKIDRSFVGRCLEQRRHRSVVDAVVSMGRSLELVVVAEGVETIAQRAFIESLGYPVLQGYLISPPIAPQRLAGWLRNLSQDASDRVAALQPPPAAHDGWPVAAEGYRPAVP
ncbi:oxygen-sensing cyclic-di-GMP phosphodiesterase DosP [Xanthobacter sediminis]